MKTLIGNRQACDALSRLIVSERVPNALLFAGPDGVGKKQFAIELARRLVCSRPDGADACGLCSACRRASEFSIPVFEKGDESHFVFFSQHPDVGMVVPFRRNLKVDAIRALENESHFRPYEARVRVFIVDEADKMNDAASNALLKTLEEPPATSHIILIASRADSLLATIRSRCQTIRFGPVPPHELAKYLVDNGNFTAEDAVLAARVSGGSVGRALAIVPASFRTQRSLMLAVLKAALASDKRELLSASEEMTDARNREEYEEKLAILRDLIHDVWLLQNGGDETGVLNIEVLDELSELSGRASSEMLAGWLADIETLYESFEVNINRKVATDALFLRMSA